MGRASVGMGLASRGGAGRRQAGQVEAGQASGGKGGAEPGKAKLAQSNPSEEQVAPPSALPLPGRGPWCRRSPARSPWPSAPAAPSLMPPSLQPSPGVSASARGPPLAPGGAGQNCKQHKCGQGQRALAYCRNCTPNAPMCHPLGWPSHSLGLHLRAHQVVASELMGAHQVPAQIRPGPVQFADRAHRAKHAVFPLLLAGHGVDSGLRCGILRAGLGWTSVPVAASLSTALSRFNLASWWRCGFHAGVRTATNMKL